MQLDHAQPRPAEQPRSWLRSNALAVAALVPIAVAAARIAVFSGGEPALLATLVQSIDVPAIVLSSIVPAAGFMVGFFTFVTIANSELSPHVLRAVRSASGPANAVFAFTLILVVYLSSLSQLVAIAAMVALGIVYRLTSDRIDKKRGSSVSADVPAVVASFMFTVLFTAAPWMPTEAVQLEDNTIQVAYVVSAGNGWTTLVDAETKLVSRIDDDDVLARTVCSKPRPRSLAQVMGNVEPPPRCPAPTTDGSLRPSLTDPEPPS